MVAGSSARPQSTALRKRKHFLQTAAGTSSPESDTHILEPGPSKPNSTSMTSPANGELEMSFASSLNEEEESDDESEERDFIPPSGGSKQSFREEQEEPSSPEGSPRRPSVSRTRSSLDLRPARAWYEFDLAVLVALVSPVGNWLTGGDHVKNLVLIIFLIFYLHQVIEVPWNLYITSRPRRRPAALDAHAGPTEQRYHELASTELHRFEIFFLSLSALSPFIGASVLQVVSKYITGEDVFSWFSTGLFVLATGIRPWSHIVDRLSARMTDLHDIIHYPQLPEQGSEDLQSELESLKRRVESFERTIGKIRQRQADNTEQLYEYVEETVDSLEATMKRHEKKLDRHDTRMKDVEHSVDKIRGKPNRPYMYVNTAAASGSTVRLPPVLAKMLPTWLVPPPSQRPFATSSPPHPLRTFSTGSDRLETIPEENVNVFARPRGPPEAASHNVLYQLFLRFTYMATFPLRSIIRLITNSS